MQQAVSGPLNACVQSDQLESAHVRLLGTTEGPQCGSAIFFISTTPYMCTEVARKQGSITYRVDNKHKPRMRDQSRDRFPLNNIQSCCDRNVCQADISHHGSLDLGVGTERNRRRYRNCNEDYETWIVREGTSVDTYAVVTKNAMNTHKVSPFCMTEIQSKLLSKKYENL